jgi:hypothetical protein
VRFDEVNMDREMLIADLRSYIANLPSDEQTCTGCMDLKINKRFGARGQIMMAFQDGTCVCDAMELCWAYDPAKRFQERPLECILFGDKTKS